MSKQHGSAFKKSLLKHLSLRFLAAEIIYTVLLVVFFFVVIIIGENIIWQDGFLYRILRQINHYREIVAFLVWLCGFIIIFFRYWSKPVEYIEEILHASHQLAEPEERLIQLSPEMKEVENTLNQVKSDLRRNARAAKEAEQRKNDLIVYLAHDLKTPLTSVIGYLSLLRDEGQISEALREKYLSVSLDKAQRLEELINEFFEITRFNLTTLSLELGRVNLNRMMEQIIYEFKPILAEKNLECTLEADPDITILCDIKKMERVFDNLIRNAVNYSYEQGTIQISLRKKGTGVQIRFENQGTTIPKEKLDRIFEQFYRLDSARTSQTGGAGLGLAISKEILELHKGKIQAFSENEKIWFEIFLPYPS